MNTIKEMYRQNEPGAFDEELEKGFVNISKIECIAIGFENVTTEYFNKNLNDLKEALNEMAKCNNSVLIGAGNIKDEINAHLKVLALQKNVGVITIYNDSKEEIGYKFHFDESQAAANVINIESSKEIGDIIGVIGKCGSSIFCNNEMLKQEAIPFELRKIEPLCEAYIPDFKKTRKEKKQQYNNNHRKNWRKRK